MCWFILCVIRAYRDNQEKVCSQTSVSTYSCVYGSIIAVAYCWAVQMHTIAYFTKGFKFRWVTMLLTPFVSMTFKVHFINNHIDFSKLFRLWSQVCSHWVSAESSKVASIVIANEFCMKWLISCNSMVVYSYKWPSRAVYVNVPMSWAAVGWRV